MNVIHIFTLAYADVAVNDFVWSTVVWSLIKLKKKKKMNVKAALWEKWPVNYIKYRLTQCYFSMINILL